MSFACLVLAMATSLGAAWGSRNLVYEQERGKLRERAAEVSLVLSSLTGSIQARLAPLGTAVLVSNGSPAAFAQVASPQLAQEPNLRGLALLRRTPEGFVVEEAAGPAFSVGLTADGERARAMERAMEVPALVSTPVMVDGSTRTLGVALGPPTAPPGTVLYREAVVRLGTQTSTTSSAAFSELQVALFASASPDPAQLVLTTPSGKVIGDVVHRPFKIGDSQWTLAVAAKKPLVGALVARLPEEVMAIGVVVSLLIFAIMDTIGRRRDYALSLVDERTSALRESLTSLESARRDAAAARDEAIEASRLKSQFLANMSHEIRTPLNGVIGMTGLLLDTGLDAEQLELAETARRSGEALLEILNDILDFSKIEAGRLELETFEFSLPDLVEGVADLFATPARDKGIDLVAVTDADVPEYVAGDSGRVRQVLTNLVSNAIKFTEAGEVVITAAVDHADRSRIRFAVRDTGIGIPPGAQDRLFESFAQADPSTTRRYGGTGLGLAISKGLVEMMGGAIGVEGGVAGGSIFWFTVPLEPRPAPEATRRDERAVSRPAAAAAPARYTPAVGPRTATGPRVLVAEDNPVNQKVATAMLSRLGYRADVVGDGREALDALARVPYAAVLMDCQMPEMNGYEAASEVRRRENGGVRIPIVAITASAVKGDEDRCLAAGMDAYVTKPVTVEALGEILAGLVAMDPTPASSAAPGRMDHQEPVLDQAVVGLLRDLDRGAPGTLRDLAAAFTTDAPADLEAMKRSLARLDVDGVVVAAHRLKGSCAALGAAGMAALASDVEGRVADGRVDQALELVVRLEQAFSDVRAAVGAELVAPAYAPAGPSRARSTDPALG
jgi:signal transduction histidine kinase/DNA-binding NarL/FixJ family response regulator